MNKTVAETIASIDRLSGRFYEMAFAAYVINGQRGLLMSEDGMKEIAEQLSNVSKTLREELLND